MCGRDFFRISHLQVLLESEDEDNDGSDNDNEKDIKIDSSVRARQLTSLVSKSSILFANKWFTMFLFVLVERLLYETSFQASLLYIHFQTTIN